MDDTMRLALCTATRLVQRGLVQPWCPDCRDRPCACDTPRDLATRSYRPVCHGWQHGCVCGACKPSLRRRLAPVVAECDEDAMTCECPAHALERTRLVERGVQEIRQPWDPRPARMAA